MPGIRNAATYAAHVRETLADASRQGLVCSIRRWTPEGAVLVPVDPRAVTVTDTAISLPDGTSIVHHGPGADTALPEIVSETKVATRMAALRAAIEGLSKRSPTRLLRIRQNGSERHVEATAVQCTSSGVFVDGVVSYSSEEIDSVETGEFSIDIRAATGQIRISL